MRFSPRGRVMALALATTSLIAATAHAADAWPNHVIKFVVPFTAGGANDLVARAGAEAVSKRIGQPVVIENRPGAGGIVGGVGCVGGAGGDGGGGGAARHETWMAVAL